MNVQWIADVVRRFQTAGALLDTNLLLVYILGSINPLQINRWKRTKPYGTKDLRFLVDFVSRMNAVFVAPGVAAETSNFLGELGGDLRRLTLERLKSYLVESREISFSCQAVANLAEFPRLGFTDSTLCEAARGGSLILTDDFPLANYLDSKNLGVLNYHHIRQIMASMK